MHKNETMLWLEGEWTLVASGDDWRVISDA